MPPSRSSIRGSGNNSAMTTKPHHVLFVLCAAVLLFPGCVQKWATVAETPAKPLEWVDQDGLPRVTYLETIRGFQQTGTTVSGALKSIVFGNQAQDNSIKQPVAVTTAHDGRIAIADPGAPCVHLYIPSEQKYVKIFRAGKEDVRTPVSVAFDEEFRLYVSDSARHAIYVFDREGVFVSAIKQAGKDALQRPTGLSYFPAKKLLFAVDTLAGKVLAFNTAGQLVFSFGGLGEQKGQLNFPTHIVVHPNGRVYVTDAMNFRVQVFDITGKPLSMFGHHGNGSGDMSLPKGIAVDRAGIIYLVDSLFDNVQMFDLAGNFLFTVGGSGMGYGEFWLPSGLHLDERDRLYVCDTYNHRVQIFQLKRNQ